MVKMPHKINNIGNNNNYNKTVMVNQMEDNSPLKCLQDNNRTQLNRTYLQELNMHKELLIIHRELEPSNINMHKDSSNPKIIKCLCQVLKEDNTKEVIMQSSMGE
jgi:hypothetical protein